MIILCNAEEVSFIATTHVSLNRNDATVKATICKKKLNLLNFCFKFLQVKTIVMMDRMRRTAMAPVKYIKLDIFSHTNEH